MAKATRIRRPVATSGIDLRPAAAFELGYCAYGGYTECLDRVLTVLVHDVQQNAHTALQQALTRLEAACREYASAEGEQKRWGEIEIESRTRNIQELADQSILEQDWLRPFYQLGAVLGDNFVRLHRSPATSPDASAMVDAFRKLPPEFRQTSRIASHIAGLDATGATLCDRFVKMLATEGLDKPIYEGQSRFTAAIQRLEMQLLEDFRHALAGRTQQEYGPDFERDGYFYEERNKRTSHKMIVQGMKSSWNPIASLSGINKAADKYAEWTGSPPRTRWKPGRPRK